MKANLRKVLSLGSLCACLVGMAALAPAQRVVRTVIVRHPHHHHIVVIRPIHRWHHHHWAAERIYRNGHVVIVHRY